MTDYPHSSSKIYNLVPDDPPSPMTIIFLVGVAVAPTSAAVDPVVGSSLELKE